MEFHFKKPKHVLHVFHNQHRYDKLRNYADYRKWLLTWPGKLACNAGYLDPSGRVLLHDSITEYADHFEQSQMLILTDRTPNSDYVPICDKHHRDSPQHVFVKNAEHAKDYSIFKIKRTDGVLSVHLNYQDNGFYIGIPRRDNFQVAQLAPNQPVRITINGKSDFSASSRRERTFYLLDYLFVYYGEFTEFATASPAQLAVERDFRFAPVKHVDLQKILR